MLFVSARPHWRAEALCSRPVRSLVRYQTCEHDVLKTNEPVLMPVGTSGPRGKGMKRSTLGSGGQMSRSNEAENRFGGLDVLGSGSSLLNRFGLMR